MIGGSWTHLLARPLIRPLIGTPVRPNHITALRLLTGLIACGCFALGNRDGMIWGGIIWLISAFLDRADGELARIGQMMSHAGHVFDYYTDNAVNTAFFLAIGVGLRHSWLGDSAYVLGVVSAASLLLSGVFSEWVELRSPPNTRAYAGRWGFDPDDALFLMAPMAWLGWLSAILVGSAFGATIVMIVTGLRLRRLIRLDELQNA